MQAQGKDSAGLAAPEILGKSLSSLSFRSSPQTGWALLFLPDPIFLPERSSLGNLRLPVIQTGLTLASDFRGR